ncbi:MAG: TIGR01212 family radical SAM protein [Alistipes sp.]|nr:TIGR01212 family radical SAM protein [Candidatus Alistipes equi]
MYYWNDNRPYNSYSSFFRRTMGERVQKVAINAGFSCPNRDGHISKGGCTFCLNEAFTPSYCTPSKSITQQIEEGIEFHKNRYRKAQSYLAYFQSFSNTYADLSILRERFSEALSHPLVKGIIIGTRPDTVDEEKLDYLAQIARHHYVAVEYGVESVYDTTLRSVNRGHDFECARRAIELTAKRKLHVGAHFILGLPGESEKMLLDATAVINSLPLNTVKFHQLQIFSGTLMAREYEEYPEKFHFWTLEEYICFFTEIIRRLRPDLVVERFASEAPPRYHAGPTWGLIRNEQLWSMLEHHLKRNNTFQGELYKG